jgi:protein-L-isoaspartate(D-aspartate) O-methyltransferase
MGAWLYPGAALAFSPTMPQNPASRRASRRREAEMIDFAAARRAMVDGQVRTNDVTDLAIIASMLQIPREAFVPKRLAAFAYLDRDVPLNSGDDALRNGNEGDRRDGGVAATGPATRWLIKPVVLARLVQATAPRPHDRALVVGAGTGYSAAILSRLAANVTALEEDLQLARTAQSNLSGLGAENVTVVTGALDKGWPASTPFDVILVDGGVEYVGQTLFDQLAADGRLGTVVGTGPIGKGMLFVSDKGAVSGRVLFDATVPLLPGFTRAPSFVF